MSRNGAGTDGPRQRRGAGAASTAERASHAAEVLRQKRLQAQRGSSSVWLRVGAGALAAGAGTLLLCTVFKPERPEEHPHYEEALRVLSNDELPSTDANVKYALRLYDAATKPYSEWGLRIVDPGEWPPRCHTAGRICRTRPAVTSVKRDNVDGWNMSLLDLGAQDVRAWLVEDFVSEEEGAALRRLTAEADFALSPTNHGDAQDWRASSSALLPADDPVVKVVKRRAAALCGVPASFVERPQAVQYRAGEAYKPHIDTDGPDHRWWTVLLYLNSPEGGGGTTFPLARLRVMPSPRAALFWENLRSEPGVPRPVRNYHALHDGQAPTGQQPKLAVNLWVRNAEYSL